MKQIEKYVSNFIQRQFPSFYNEEGATFIEFVKAYYEWMEQTGQTNYYARQIPSIKDVDNTLDEFIIYFREKYLAGLPYLKTNNQEELIKFSRDLYRSKGTEQCIKLLFALLYNERNVDIFYPKSDVLRPSDGKWIQPLYLEVSISDRSQKFTSKEITGSVSGAKAFVESVVRKQINDRFFDVIFITDVRGQFVTGELITDDGILLDAPKVIGSLIDISILNGGANNAIGDILQVLDSQGREGTARVTGLQEGTGRVRFTILDGGSGYVTTSTLDSYTNTIVVVSNTTMVITNVSNPNTSINSFFQYETVTQPVVSVDYAGPTGSLSNVSIIRAVNATSGFIANTQLVSSNASNIFAVKLSGTFANAVSIRGYDGSNAQVFAASIASANEFNISGNVVFSNTSTIGLHQVKNGPFIVNTGSIRGANSNTSASIVSIYTGRDADFDIGALSNTETLFLYTDMLYDVNTSNVPYMSILISGTNSNVAANGYGFPKAPFATLGNYIESALGSNTFTIGTIASLTNINPGQDYNVDPPTIAYNRYIAGYNRRDFVINTANAVGVFIPGELVTQNVATSVFSIGITGANGAFAVGEGIIQNTTNAQGYITAANSSILTVVKTSSNSFNTGLSITGTVTSTVANVSTNATGFTYSFAKGVVKSSNSSTLFLKRLTFGTGFDLSSPIIGTISNATATPTLVQLDPSTRAMGDNAVIDARAVTASGIISDIEIISSGIGYSPTNTLLLKNPNNPITASGRAVIDNYGTGTGYWVSDDGFLNVKYLHDNKYYQDYSYEIQAGLSLNRYGSLLKQVFHIAGSELFGKVMSVTELDELEVVVESEVSIT